MVIKGGDWFIDAAVWIARITGMPEVLIGATVISVGTTFPELIVSTTSAIHGHSDMALGNAIGSTICNIGIILGACNIIRPTKISSRIYGVKAVLMILYTFIFMVISLDRQVSRINGFMLIFCFIIFIFVSYLEAKIKNNSIQKQKRKSGFTIRKSEIFICLLKFLLGAIFVIGGAKLLIKNGVIISYILGVPDMVVSLTAIALGTSLPELVTSVSALIKGHRNLAVGNIVGANILNMSMVLGFSSIFQPLTIPRQTLKLDIPFSMLMMLTLTIPTLLSWKITRFHAFVLVSLYFTYLAILGHLFL